jgi:2-methylfumaryl-CoA isomerase
MAALASALSVDLSDEGARWKARKAITEILKPWFAARRVADIGPMFDRAGVTWSVFRTFAEALDEDEDFSTANPMFSVIDQPGAGRHLAPASPVTFSGAEREPARPGPNLGQHTEEILADVAGLSGREIGSLFDAGIVACPETEVRMAS